MTESATLKELEDMGSTTSEAEQKRFIEHTISHNPDEIINDVPTLTSAEQALRDYSVDQFIEYVDKKRKFCKEDTCYYILNKYHAIVSPTSSYMYLHDNVSGLYTTDHNGRMVKTVAHMMFGDDATDAELSSVADRSFMIPRYHRHDISTMFDHPGLIPFRNGVLDVVNDELIDYTPDTPFLNNIPWDYNPDARCPSIDAMMPRIFTDKQILDEYEWGGYVLTPGNRYKKIKVYLGETDSGKSTYLRLYQHLVGSHNVTPIEPQQIGKEYYIAYFHNKVLNICGDVSAKRITDFSRFKMLTGDDDIQANVKNGAMITFRNMSKSMWATNKLAPIDDPSSAAYNRLMLTMCGKVIIDDHDFIEADMYTDEEMSGLINHFVEGLRRLEERGHFDIPSVEKRMAEYNRAANAIFEWADDTLEFTGDKSDQVCTAMLYQSFKHWHTTYGIICPLHKEFIGTFKKAFNSKYVRAGTVRPVSDKPGTCKGIAGVKLIESE